MKHIRKISDYAMIGGLSALVVVSLQGCGSSDKSSDSQNTQSLSTIAKTQGAFVIIEEQANGAYKILEEYPSDTTRIVLKKADGSERMLTQEEIDQLIKSEATKIDQGTSQLTNPQGGGLSLGETILASAAGAMLGSWIGSKLFNNQNYQSQQRTSYKSPQAYERSQNSFKSPQAGRASTGAASGRGGFFSPQQGGASSSAANKEQSSQSSGG